MDLEVDAMKFGMPALLEHGTLAEDAALCRELGLDFIELNLNVPQYQPGRWDAHGICRVGEEYGVDFTIHLDENLNLFEFNPLVADAWQKTLLDNIALAKAIGAKVLNMHLNRGVVFTLPEKKVYVFEKFLPEYLKGLAKVRDLCEQAMGDSGIRICMENTAGWLPWQVEALDTLLRSPVFGLTLDVGHDHCTGAGDLEVITARKDRLRHMHLHDAIRPSRDHLALGTGELDLPTRLQLAAEQDCTVVIEVKTAASLRESVKWLK